MVTGQSGFPRSDQRWSKHIMVTTAMLTTPMFLHKPTSWSPVEWDTVKTRHASTHDLQAEPKIWTPRQPIGYLANSWSNWTQGRTRWVAEVSRPDVGLLAAMRTGRKIEAWTQPRIISYSPRSVSRTKPQIEIIVKVIMTIDLAQVPPTVVKLSTKMKYGDIWEKHGKSTLTEVF